MRTHRCLVLMLAGAIGISACTSYKYTKKADEATKTGNWDAAVYYYLEALAKEPDNARYKMELQRLRFKAAESHFQLGQRFRNGGQLQRALTEFELAVQLDPTHQFAEVELEKVRKDLAVLAQEGGLTKLEAMKKAAGEMKVKPPMLNPASDEPISLNFPNPTNVRDIYKAIGQAFGVNIIFDPKLKDNKITIELKNVRAMQALELVMQTSGHFYKVLDDRELIVVDDTPQNRKDYEDLVVKAFFLSNADVKEVNNLLRAIIDARRIAINEQLNSLVIRDTADRVAIAERMINAADKAKAEVLIDVELIQIDSTKSSKLGTQLGSYSNTFSVDSTKLGGTTTGVPLANIGDITRSMWNTVLPSVTLSLIKSAGEAETLAQPQLRITEREKGSLVIGSQIAVPTTSFNTSQTISGGILPMTAYQYKDVGIKIDIEPRVHHNNEVTLKLKIEVSERLPDPPGSSNAQPTFGTRTIDSTIRLKNGETSLLAGLFKYNKIDNRSGVPWLADLPIIGGLFRYTTRDMTKSDLVLTLTPHIIRNPDITEEDLAPLWVGTENRVTIFGNSPQIRSKGSGSPFGDLSNAGVGINWDDGPTPIQEPPMRPPRQGAGDSPNRPPGVRPRGSVADPNNPDSVAATDGLATLTWNPPRLRAKLGQEVSLSVILDPGIVGVSNPLHFVYDPNKLDVIKVEGGELPGSIGQSRVNVTHTPAIGWITASWGSAPVGSATLMKLTIRPKMIGEIPLVFAGPVGAVTESSVVIVGLPETATIDMGKDPQ